jgi:predicted dehydrogenase
MSITNIVVGSGYWGKNLVKNFCELGALRTICDQNIATLRAFQEKYLKTRFQTSFDEVEPLKAECAPFLNCIECAQTPRTNGKNGIRVLKVLNACQESLHLQGRSSPRMSPITPWLLAIQRGLSAGSATAGHGLNFSKTHRGAHNA